MTGELSGEKMADIDSSRTKLQQLQRIQLEERKYSDDINQQVYSYTFFFKEGKPFTILVLRITRFDFLKLSELFEIKGSRYPLRRGYPELSD